MKTRIFLSLILFLALFAALLLRPPQTLAWGEHGHKLIGRAAGTNLPRPMPLFFRRATAQFEYLNPEPDRWKEKALPEMTEAFYYDHFLDWEFAPEGALDQKDRFEYLIAMTKAGVDKPKGVGFLPFHIVELYQRLRTEFHLWRNTKSRQQRAWIEQRILNDAGILGHYVADGSNPHHTTVHYNGWNNNFPNPNNFPSDNTFHGRFEIKYVQSHILIGDIVPKLNPTPRLIKDVRVDTIAYLQQSHSFVSRLYELDRAQPFNEQTTATDHKRFAVERIVAGASMLRDLWWTAWIKSETLD